MLHSDALADAWVQRPNTNPLFAGADAARLHDRAAACRRCRTCAGCSTRGAPAVTWRAFRRSRWSASSTRTGSSPRGTRPAATASSSRIAGRRRAPAGDLRARRRDQRSPAGGAPALPGHRRRRAGLRRSLLARRQRGVLPSASAGQPVQRSRSRRVVRGVRARDGAGRSRVSQERWSWRRRLDGRRVDHLRRLPGGLQRGSFTICAAARGFTACLDPRSYVASQALAERLLEAGSLGIVYPSVRDAGGTCVACFRPPLVANVRRDARIASRFTAPASPAIARER